MELTCTTFSFPLLSFEDACKVIALLKIPCVDVGAHAGGSNIQPDDIEARPDAVAERIRRAIGESGLRASDLFPTFGYGFRDRPVNASEIAVRDANLARFRSMVEVGRAIGGKGITLLPGVVWDELGIDGSFELSVRELSRMVPIAHDAGLRLSVECHLESVAEPPQRARELIDAVPGLQLTLDYSHFVANGYRPEDVHPLIPFTGHFHARQARNGYLQAPEREGTLDFADIVRRLKAASYPGDICVEYTWQEWRGANNVDALMESILLRDKLLRYLAD